MNTAITKSPASITPSTETGTVYSSGYIWYAVLLLALVNAINYMDRMALSVLLPFIKQDLLLSDTQLGALTGFAFAFFYAAFGIPIARWADRSSRRNIVALAMVVWSVMTSLSGLAHNFIALFCTRVGVGVGEAGCIAPSQSMISDYVPADRRAGMLAIYAGGSMVGTILGLSLTSWLAAEFGWRATFIMLGIPGAILALVVKFTLQDPPRGYSDGKKLEANTQPILTILQQVFSCKTFVYLVIFLVVSGFVNYGMNQWLPSFFMRSFNMAIEDVGFYYGISLGLGSTLGLIGGGFWCNRLARTGLARPLWLGAGFVLLAIPLTWGIFFVPSASMAFVLIFVSQIFWSIPGGAIFSSAQSVVAPNVRATASAIMILFISVVGFGLGPFLVGLLSDGLQQLYGVESLRYSLLGISLLMPLMVLFLGFAAKHIDNDIAKVR